MKFDSENEYGAIKIKNKKHPVHKSFVHTRKTLTIDVHLRCLIDCRGDVVYSRSAAGDTKTRNQQERKIVFETPMMNHNRMTIF